MKKGALVVCVFIVLLASSASATHTTKRLTSPMPRLTTSVNMSMPVVKYPLQPVNPLLSRLELSLDPYRCMDSDGGINPFERGAVLRIPHQPTQACMDWVAELNQLCPPDPFLCRYNPAACAALLSYCYTTALPEECFGDTKLDSCRNSQILREYYCSGSDIRYRDITCDKRTCTEGRCA